MEKTWFTEKLRQSNISQRELARRVGIPEQRIGDIARERRKIKLSEAPIIAKSLGVTLDELAERMGG